MLYATDSSATYGTIQMCFDRLIEYLFLGLSYSICGCFQAVEQLNIKPNYWKDLVTDEPFTRKDIITIQDPTKLDKFNLASFYHVRKNLKLVSEGWLLMSQLPKCTLSKKRCRSEN